VSQHLIKLKKAGLIQDEKEGKYVYYALTNPKIGILTNELRKYATISTP
jgi:DNA-binding transcriptional ArsR family regulator